MAHHGHVYALLTSQGIKIGYSNTPKKRIVNLCNKYKVKKDDRKSFIGPYSKLARLLEGDIHKAFLDNALGGEVFDIPFQLAVDEIKKTLIPTHEAMSAYLNVPYKSKCKLTDRISKEVRKEMINRDSKDFTFICDATGLSRPKIKSIIDCRVDISIGHANMIADYLGLNISIYKGKVNER